MAHIQLTSSSQLAVKLSESKYHFSKSKSRGKPQIIQLKIVFLHFLKSNRHSTEEMLGDGKNLDCFDLFTLKLRLSENWIRRV